MVTIHTHQLNAGDLGVEGLITEADELTVRIRIPIRGLTGVPNNLPQMRNLEYVLRIVLLCIHKLRYKADIEQAVVLTVVVDSPGIRRNVVTVGVGNFSSVSHLNGIRSCDRLRKSANKRKRKRRCGNRSPATAGNLLILHAVKSSFHKDVLNKEKVRRHGGRTPRSAISGHIHTDFHTSKSRKNRLPPIQ